MANLQRESQRRKNSLKLQMENMKLDHLPWDGVPFLMQKVGNWQCRNKYHIVENRFK